MQHVMSVSQFGLLVIGVQASTSRMPLLFKGAGVEWIAKQILRDVRKCGYHGRVVFGTGWRARDLEPHG